MSTKLYEVDPSLIEGKPLPLSFTATVYSPGALMRRLGIDDESTFWLHYRAGMLPHGVWLPTDPPIVCWDRELIENWIAAGRPIPEQIVMHNYVVLSRLMQDVEDTLPARPLTQTEVN
jgi:hypothetical protein